MDCSMGSNCRDFMAVYVCIHDLNYAGICDEMLELYGGGKKKEKTEASDEGSSSNHSSPLPSSSPPTKKRVSHLSFQLQFVTFSLLNVQFPTIRPGPSCSKAD